MILNLDFNQRLNLVSILDGIEHVGRREAWAVCALQARIDLSDEERAAIGWRKLRADNGHEYVIWNREGTSDAKQFDLSEDDSRRICNAIDRYPVILGRDKHWYLPLCDQLPKPEEKPEDKLERVPSMATRNGG